MSRTKGNLKLASNFERQINAPLDATAVVSTIADLTKEDTFISTDGNNYCYYGMLVSVTEPNNVGVYKLVNPGTDVSANVAQKDSANWKLIAGEDADVKNKIQNITYAVSGETSFTGNICFGNRYYEPLEAENNFKVNTNGSLGWYVWKRVFINENGTEILPESYITITNVKLKYATGRVLTSNNISIKFSDWQYFQKAFNNRSVVVSAINEPSNGINNYKVKYYQLTQPLNVVKVGDLYQFTYNNVIYNVAYVSNYLFKATSIVDSSIEVECIAQVKTLDELVKDTNFAVIVPNEDKESDDGTYTVTFSVASSDDKFLNGTPNISSNNGNLISDDNGRLISNDKFTPTLNWNSFPTVAKINKCKLYLSNKQATIKQFTDNDAPTEDPGNLFTNLDNYTGVLGDFSYTQNSHYTGNLIHESHEYKDGYNTMILEYQPRSFGDSNNTNIGKLFSGEYGDEDNNIRSWDTSLRVTTNPELGCVQIFNFSYAEGFGTVAAGGAAHAEGKGCGTYEDFSHVEGSNNINIGYGAHVEGWNNTNYGYGSHVEGGNNLCTVNHGHAEGQYNEVNGYAAHAEGYKTTASSKYSHAEGESTTASSEASHAEGYNTKALSSFSHAEGESTTASGKSSHAEGGSTTASGNYSHTEGNRTTASGNYSHAEGANTTASDGSSHAEGANTTASGRFSHAEGYYTTALSDCSHAEGNRTTASGETSHTEGYRTIASGRYQHAQGKYNIEDTENKYAFIIGNGTDDENRSNAFTVDWGGDITASGIVTNKSAVSFSSKYYDDTTNMVNAKGWYVWNYELFDKDGNPASDALMLSFGTPSALFKVRCYPGKVDTTGAGLTGVICNWTDFNKLSTLIKTPNNGTVLSAFKTENVQLSTTSTLTYAKTFNKYEIIYFDKLQSRATNTVVTDKVTLYLKTTDKQQFKWGSTYDCLNYNNDKTYNYSLLLSDEELKAYTTTLTTKNDVFNPYLNIPNAMSKTPITNSNGIIISNTAALTKIKFYCTDVQCPVSKWKKSNPSDIGTSVFSALTAIKNYKTLKFSYVQDAKHTDVLTNATISGNTITFDYVNERQDFVSPAYRSSAWNMVESKDWKYGKLDKDGVRKLRNWDGTLRTIDHLDVGVAELYPFVYAEGYENVAAGGAAHAEGKQTQAVEDFSHAEGSGSIARGYACHAEGGSCHAEGECSHAEGKSCKALGHNSHAEGNATEVKPSAYTAHAEGRGTVAASPIQHVQGMYNVLDDQRKYADIIGWGSGDSNRKNIQTTDIYGNFRTAGSIEASDGSNITTNQVKCWYYWGKKAVSSGSVSSSSVSAYYLWLGSTQRSYKQIQPRGAMADWDINQPVTLSSISVGDVLSIYNGDFYANSLEVVNIYTDDFTTTGSNGIVLQVKTPDGSDIDINNVLNIKKVEEGTIPAATTDDKLPKEKYQYAVINTTLTDGKLSKLLDGETPLTLTSNIFGNDNISYGRTIIFGNNNTVNKDGLIVIGNGVNVYEDEAVEIVQKNVEVGGGATVIDKNGYIYTNGVRVKSPNTGFQAYTIISEGNINIAQDDNVVDITPTSITINGDNLLDKIAKLEARIAALEAKVK